MPNFKKDFNRIREELENAFPGYFRHWPEDKQFDDAAQEASFCLRYVSSHSAKLAQERVNSGVDLALLAALVEGPAEECLRGHRALLRSYVWHQLSARRQHAALQDLMSEKGLPLGHSLLLCDYREKVRLPFGPSEMSAMWHAQQKWAITCFGIVLFRHHPESTQQRPRLEQVNGMYLTEVREQVAETSNRLIDEFIKETDVSAQGDLRIFTDCGPHFRAAECLHHHAYGLCTSRKQRVHVNYLAEQHGKNILDSLFGTTGLGGGWLGDRAKTRAVHNVADLEAALQWGANRTMQADPAGPKWTCRTVNLGSHRQRGRRLLSAESTMCKQR